MFVQVIQGKVGDPQLLRAAYERWRADLAPGADGWLGSTGGVTDDNRFVVLARFASAEQARQNSDRPEQGEWWAEVAQALDGEASFADSVDVDVDQVGELDQAGFVQVMRYRVSDPERARELGTRDAEAWQSFRPDILGTLVAMHEDGAATMAVYFTSEQEARAGETKEPPAEIKATMQEMDALNVGETEFFDLREPWLDSA